MSFLKGIKSNLDKFSYINLSPRKEIKYYSGFNHKRSPVSTFRKQCEEVNENNISKSSFYNGSLPRTNENNFTKEELEHNSFTINQAEIGLRKFIKENKDKFFNRLIKGPPESFRWISWIIAAEIPEDRNQEIFVSLLKKEIDKKTDIQIKKDLNRTISEDNLFILGNSQNALYNVLKAYAISDQEVAYCQGMNFIAGFLLIISDFNEVDTLYMMMSLFMFTFGENNLGIRGFYINEFPLLRLYVYVFEVVFNKFLPELKQHFDKLEVPNELWISKWFQTLFTVCIPVDLLVRVWDCFLSEGLDFLFNFSIALLKKHEKNLLSFQDISDISEYFRNMNPSLTKEKDRIKFDVEELISSALELKISKTLLNTLRLEYENKFKVDLSLFKFKLDVKSHYSSSKEYIDHQGESKNNSNLESLLNTLNNLDVKLDLNCKLSHATNNEEMKKSTYHCSSTNKIIPTDEIENSCDVNDDTINSICSELDLFENNTVGQKVITHTFRRNMERGDDNELKTYRGHIK